MTYSASIKSVLVLTMGIAVAACDDGGGDGGGGTGGMSGAAGGAGAPAGVGELVQWGATDAWIEGTANPFGIKGAWYSYNDCMDAQAQTPPLPCTMPDMTMMGPDMMPGWRVVSATEVCAKGIAPKVDKLADGTTDAYSFQWGSGIAFELNNMGGEGATPMPFNAEVLGITGFSFDIRSDATPAIPATLRINIPIPATNTAENRDAHFREVPVTNTSTTQNVMFATIMQGPWAAMATPSHVETFRPAEILAVQFQVFTKTASTTPYDFCVSNFRVLQ